VGQLVFECLPQVLDDKRLTSGILGWTHIGHKPWSAGLILTQQDRGISHFRPLGENCLYFARLYAKPVEFDLTVDPSEKDQPTIGQIARAITGLVQAGAGL
jgi:hypothetical protein